MARVTGFTAERMQTIEDTCIVDGAVLLDDLILTQRDGTQINAGNVRGPQGLKGDQGIQGIQGIQGFKGDKGDKGDQGIQGIQGVDGVQGSAATPAGTITLWGSDVAPANWLICDGSAVSRTTYASLFATIGTKYGAGDGVNTFNLPNLKGQTPVGKDTTQTEFAALNQKGGEKKHLLVVSEMPSHTHLQNAHNHGRVTFENGGEAILIEDQGGDTSGNNRWRVVSGTNATHLSTANATATDQNTGGDVAHNVLQPYTVVNFIIKFTNGDSPNDSQLTQRVSTVESWMGQTPAGTVTIWGGDTAPTNWLLCDGSAVSRTTYASLFAVIGTKYGAGDGSSTFNLPNFKGRTPTGLDATQTEFNALGKTGGEKTHILTTAEMPSHNHGTNETAHGHPQNVSANPGIAGGTSTRIDYTSDGVGGIYGQGIFTGGATTGITIQNTGGGGAHNVLSPYLTVNYIIKFTNGDTQGDSQLTQRVSTLEGKNTYNDQVERLTRRAQHLFMAGGVRKVASGGISWTGSFQMVGTGRDVNAPSGGFSVDFPANGTVIPVYFSGGVTSATVANGQIPLSGYQALYYELPIGQVSTSQASKFRIVDYISDQAFAIPNNWVLICARNSDPNNMAYKWGDGRSQDFWHLLTLMNGWTNYGGAFPTVAYRLENSGKVLMRGMVSNTSNVTTAICAVPAALAPEFQEIFTNFSWNAEVRIDAFQNGNIVVQAYDTGSGAGWVSISGISWFPSGS